MATSVETPAPDEACSYCGARIFDHDPLCVRDCVEGCGSPEYVCNYACLVSDVEAEGLTTGTACEWSPE